MQQKTIFQALTDEGVEYVLIGGLAAVAQGVSLVTQDTDICFRQNIDNCERLTRALARLEAEIYPTRTNVIPITAELLQKYKLILLKTKLGRLEETDGYVAYPLGINGVIVGQGDKKPLEGSVVFGWVKPERPRSGHGHTLSKRMAQAQLLTHRGNHFDRNPRIAPPPPPLLLSS